MTTRFDIIAFPRGRRTVVATVFRREAVEAVRFAAPRAAALYEGFVDVERGGRTIATVGPDGECIA